MAFGDCLNVVAIVGSLALAGRSLAAPGDITTVAGGPGYGPAAELEMYPTGLAARGSELFVADGDFLVVRRIDLETGQATVVAGDGYGSRDALGDGRTATQASLPMPQAVAFGADGALLIADPFAARVRRVDPSSGIISTVAGGGTSAPVDGALATSLSLGGPLDIAVDRAGNLLVLDDAVGVFRVDAVSSGIHRITASMTWRGMAPCPDGVLGTTFFPTQARGIAADRNGDLVLADTEAARVCRIEAATDLVRPIAGGPFTGSSDPVAPGTPATEAFLGYVYDVSIDSRGNVYLPFGYRVWRVDRETSELAPVAGDGVPGYSGDGGPAIEAHVGVSTTLTVGTNDDVFFLDTAEARLRIRRVDAATGQIATITGAGPQVMSGDGGPALGAQFNRPEGVALDRVGNLYIADRGDHRVRRVDPRTGTITAVAGNGQSGLAGDGGPAVSAQLAQPKSMVVDDAGNLLILDQENARVRRVDGSSGIISTYAGSCSAGGPGDGGPAAAACLSYPRGIALDLSNSLLVAESNRIRRIDRATGVISTVAGGGSGPVYAEDGEVALGAYLGELLAVAVEPAGGILFADTGRLRRIDPVSGRLRTIANAAGVFDYPSSIAVDPFGYAYIADFSGYTIRRFDLSTGEVLRLAGSLDSAPPVGGSGDGGPASQARLAAPADVAFDAEGNLFIADSRNRRIRRIAHFPVCHDGHVDPGEECDDGNREDGDGCDADCTITRCGNGRATTGEECDDGNQIDGDGCSADCRIERGWSCGGRPSYCSITCGDGVVLPGAEECDDGGFEAGDGCSPSCHVEPGWTCSGEPSVCVPICGDGEIVPPEQCDDGNVLSGDGCSPTCQIERGWLCVHSPSSCETVCGDGLIRGNEQCDDGNISSYDGCSADCEKDPGAVCQGEPSVCSRCGDGIVGAFETCDDGNARDGDCCSAHCQPEPLDQPCPDDGDPATVDSCDVGGVCRHRATPLAECKPADGATLSLQQTTRGPSRLLWKWRGTGTPPADFGDPMTGTTYRLAIYDGGGTRVAFQANVSPPLLWRPIGKKGLRYRSPFGWPSGITAIDLQAAASGKAKLLVRGKGSNLILPASLALTPPVTVQLSRGGSEIECWESVFDRPLIDLPSRLEARR